MDPDEIKLSYGFKRLNKMCHLNSRLMSIVYWCINHFQTRQQRKCVTNLNQLWNLHGKIVMKFQIIVDCSWIYWTLPTVMYEVPFKPSSSESSVTILNVLRNLREEIVRHHEKVPFMWIPFEMVVSFAKISVNMTTFIFFYFFKSFTFKNIRI